MERRTVARAGLALTLVGAGALGAKACHDRLTTTEDSEPGPHHGSCR